MEDVDKCNCKGLEVARFRKNIANLEDLINLLKNEDKFIRTGMGPMWKMENNKLYYKPKGVNNFFEIEIEGNWFVDPIEILEVKNKI